jgi:hypothetical protein
MKRSTWITVGLFAVLVAAWLFKTQRSAPKGPPPLTIDGYAAADGKPSDGKATPVDQLIVQTAKASVELTRQAVALPQGVTPDTQKPAESEWTAKRTVNGKSSEAKVQAFRAQAMAEVFAQPIRSTFAKEVGDKDRAEYGLDDAQAITVQAQIGGKRVKLRIGHADKPQDGAEATTWLQDPDRPTVVYQVAGRDLRAPFAVSWSDLRDRSLLKLDLASIEKIEVDNPADSRHPHFVLTRPPLDKGATREAAAGWQILEPAGFAAGEVGEWLKNIERMAASEFVDGSAAADSGLDDPKVAARVVLSHGATKTVLVFGATDAKSTAKDVWARIDGRDDTFKVATFTRDQVVQRLDQVRNRALLGPYKAAEAVAVTLQGPDGRLQLRKDGSTWTAASATVDSAAISAWLAELDSVRVDFAADVTPTGAGLDTPAITAEFTLASGTWQLALGADKNGTRYGRAAAQPATGDVFSLTTWHASKLTKKASDFAPKKADAAPAAGDAAAPPPGLPAGLLNGQP